MFAPISKLVQIKLFQDRISFLYSFVGDFLVVFLKLTSMYPLRFASLSKWAFARFQQESKQIPLGFV